MMGRTAIVCLVLGWLAVPGATFAQLVPPAGSAGAGNAPISGIPYGPANPSSVGDPSGVLNASRVPPVGTNTPAPVTTYGSVYATSPSRRVVTPPYAGASQRMTSLRQVRSRKAPFRPRGRVETSKFTGICRGC